MNSIALPKYIHIPDNQLNPPEFPEWTDRDKREAVDRLVDRITNGEAWDENCTGWKGDLHATYDSIMTRYKTTSLKLDEAMLEMSVAFDEHVLRHAQDEVAYDPDKYCEETDDEF
jgi:hypothetical protein